MQMSGRSRLYSASDLVAFVECEHVTTLDLIDLETPLPRAAADDSERLVQEKGIEHERAFLKHLKSSGLNVAEIGTANETLLEKASATHAAMRGGADIIYQATLIDGSLLGFTDFLVRVGRPSTLGDYGYEVWDTKLSRSPKAKFVVQLAYYSRLLAVAQGAEPAMMHVVLGDRTLRSYRCADYAHYFDSLLQRFVARVETAVHETYPEPCSYCGLCKWEDLCTQKWLTDDHLSQVANITRIQIAKLQAADITTMAKLAAVKRKSVPKMRPETLGKLRAQAQLQVQARDTGTGHVELLELDPDQRRGFYRLPEPNPGDMFFDMEGNPWEEGGLEYLFGVYVKDRGRWRFNGFWAHSRQEERVAFEQFIDFVMQRLRKFPGAHIYHYASYEETALKKLMSLHATREVEVDNLLRHRLLVDLYKVVREAIRISEPKYSLKNIEHFYLGAREGDVKDAGASVVWYERWRETQDQSLLDAIERYNEDDVRSTQGLRDWLLTHRPAGLPWAVPPSGDDPRETAVITRALTRAEARLVPYRAALIDPLPVDRSHWTSDESARELAYQLLDFHRRADKPAYWALFARMEMTEDDLLEDAECIAAMELDAAVPPFRDKQSLVYTYRYPEQETKLRDGSQVTRTDNGRGLGQVELDPEARRAVLRQRATKEPLPQRLSIGPGGPIDTDSLRNALFRYADSQVRGAGAYRAVDSILRRDAPLLIGHVPGEPLIAAPRATVEAATDVVLRLDHSHLFIQGPPGAGKTYTVSHLIVALMATGHRVGVTSNSHKPIHNLLDAVVKVAEEKKVTFRGVKKATRGTDAEFSGRHIANLYDNDEVLASGAPLIAGTAWLFADPAADQLLDYLFVDEAGQVSLANLVAMGMSARNIVLLGDQMQLAQPIQGTHPGQSGSSSLNYLLGDVATIAPDRGIFLETTWRMHPDVCRFISDAVYDSRLEPEPGNKRRVLRLEPDAHPLLRPSGIVFAPLHHSGCSQQSPEEADLIGRIYKSALQQRYVTREGRLRRIGAENILVVAPYNMQVNRLRRALPAGARVGTVDKFQGQEAEVVLISMTTSSETELPRNIEFLYSKNRLNVAISRAKSLAILMASPALMQTRCSTPEQMALVNTLCWLTEYAELCRQAKGGEAE